MTKFHVFIDLLIICQILMTVKASNFQFAKCSPNESCISHKECEAIQEILKRGPRLSKEDKEYFRKVQCDSQNRLAYVCCANKVNFMDKLPKAPKCGIQLTDRIIGGEVANINEFPWTVQIFHKNQNNLIVSDCGGVLITDRYVLTAAHCIRLKPIKVRLGDWDTRTDPDCDDHGICNNPYVEIPIQNITVHGDYNMSINAQCNDIALIKLQTNVTITKYIKPICLPIDPLIRNMNMTGHLVEVAGFGVTSLQNFTMSDRKMKLGLNISPQSYCEQVYARKNVAINSKQICAGGEEGRDSCIGDSGGPLMKQINKPGEVPYYSLVGLVSFGPAKCGIKDYPGVYTRISEFMNWIVNNMD